MWNVIYTRKTTGEKFVYGTCQTIDQATHICEMWGWIFDDGTESFWMSVERSQA